MTVSKFRLKKISTIVSSSIIPFNKVGVSPIKSNKIEKYLLNNIGSINRDNIHINNVFTVVKKQLHEVLSDYGLCINDFDIIPVQDNITPSSCLYNEKLKYTYLFLITDYNYFIIDNDRILSYDIQYGDTNKKGC